MKETWVMPEWMEKYRHLIELPNQAIPVEHYMNNMGGVGFFEISMVATQVVMLHSLHAGGFLK